MASLLRFTVIALLAMTAMSDTPGAEWTADTPAAEDSDASITSTLADAPADAPEPPGVPLDWVKRGGAEVDPMKVYKSATTKAASKKSKKNKKNKKKPPPSPKKKAPPPSPMKTGESAYGPCMSAHPPPPSPLSPPYR